MDDPRRVQELIQKGLKELQVMKVRLGLPCLFSHRRRTSTVAMDGGGHFVEVTVGRVIARSGGRGPVLTSCDG